MKLNMLESDWENEAGGLWTYCVKFSRAPYCPQEMVKSVPGCRGLAGRSHRCDSVEVFLEGYGQCWDLNLLPDFRVCLWVFVVTPPPSASWQLIFTLW